MMHKENIISNVAPIVLTGVAGITLYQFFKERGIKDLIDLRDENEKLRDFAVKNFCDIQDLDFHIATALAKRSMGATSSKSLTRFGQEQIINEAICSWIQKKEEERKAVTP